MKFLLLFFFLNFNLTGAQLPNIVFVLIDDMGWNDLGYMGSDLYETPYIDSLSAKGIRFTDAYAAAPLCSASRAAILTGWSPARQHLHGVTPSKRTAKYESAFADYESWDVPAKMRRSKAMQVEVPIQLGQLPLSSMTIAERLKEKNYATGFFGKWHLGPDADKHPDQQGFDVAVADTPLGFPKSYFSPYQNPNLEDGPKGEYLTNRLTDEACEFMRKSVSQKQPFFCYLSHYAVHGPWQAEAEDMAYFKNKVEPGMIHQNEIYAAMVKGVDDSIGKLQATLRDLGIEKNTLIIFTSDNGAVGKKKTASDSPYVSRSIGLRGEKALTYEGGIRVPQFMVWPGQIQPAVVDVPVVGMDFYPTLLSVTGLEPAEDNPLDGVDLSPLFRGGSLDRTQLTFFMPHYMGLGGDEPVPSSGVIRQGDWKLIKFWQGGFRLYNLKDDLVEQHDLSAAMPEKVAVLEQQLMAELKRQNAFIPAINSDWDEAAFEKYRAQRRGDKTSHK
jgi:arylsulfatase A-like enzyme